jgi:hypothetical protein
MKTKKGYLVIENDDNGGIIPFYLDHTIAFMNNGVDILIPFSLVSRLYRVMEHECNKVGVNIEDYERECLNEKSLNSSNENIKPVKVPRPELNYLKETFGWKG